MLRSIASRAVITVGSLVTATGLALGLGAAITPASAATISTKDTAGYQLSGGQFRYVQTTVYARAIGQYANTMGAGLGHGITLSSATK